MNDRELHCRGKANEARLQSRAALTDEDRQILLELARDWERQADEAARDHLPAGSSSRSAPNHAA